MYAQIEVEMEGETVRLKHRRKKKLTDVRTDLSRNGQMEAQTEVETDRFMHRRK